MMVVVSSLSLQCIESVSLRDPPPPSSLYVHLRVGRQNIAIRRAILAILCGCIQQAAESIHSIYTDY